MAADPARRAVALPVLRLLRRISAGYAVLGISVPVLGIGVAVQLGVLTSAWLVAAMVLTAGAAALLTAVVLPQQGRLLAAVSRSTPPPATGGLPESEAFGTAGSAWHESTRRLSMLSGVFALLWAVVVVLMIVRPGSTTGA